MRARDNPFSTDRLAAIRYRPRGWTWDQLLDRLATLDYRAAIVGPHGSGKTTLLEHLESRLRDRGLSTRLTRTLPDSIHPNEILLLDSAERLTTLDWLSLRWRTRHSRGLVVTAHHPGRLPTLTECTTDPALLTELITDLLGSCPPEVKPETLHHDHHGNLRSALLSLYDQVTRSSTRSLQAR